MKSNGNMDTIIKCIQLLIITGSIYACADVYQWQDKDGNTHLSDRVHDNSRRVDLNPGYAYYKVNKVYDGDTVKLSDARKIRLLGINTPEVKHRNQDTEAGGEIAKHWLTNKLLNQKAR